MDARAFNDRTGAGGKRAISAERRARVRSTTPASDQDLPDESVTGGIFFCGDTRFFSLHHALQTIAQQKLTGTSPLILEPRAGRSTLFRMARSCLATTRDPELYCPGSAGHLDQCRCGKNRQCARAATRKRLPAFPYPCGRESDLQEPATQLVQHHGQKLFAQLWSMPRIRFSFQHKTCHLTRTRSPAEADVDQWALATLRLIQFHELGSRADYDPSAIPAYTSDGYESIQRSAADRGGSAICLSI